MSTTTVDATVLTDALLKRGPSSVTARAAMRGALVLGYALKEVRHGPFANYVYAYNVLVKTGTLSAARTHIAALGQQRYKQQTAVQALNDAEAEVMAGAYQEFAAVLGQVGGAMPGMSTADEVVATMLRDVVGRRIHAAFKELTTLATTASHALACFTVGTLRTKRDGSFDVGVGKCPDACALGGMLTGQSAAVSVLIGVVQSLPPKRENIRRIEALQWVAQHPGQSPDTEYCRALGDAVYALLCPAGGMIVTTNVADHQPLASALGKSVTKP